MDTLDLAMQSPLKAVGEADNILMRLVRQIGRTASTVVITKSEYKMIQTRYAKYYNCDPDQVPVKYLLMIKISVAGLAQLTQVTNRPIWHKAKVAHDGLKKRRGVKAIYTPGSVRQGDLSGNNSFYFYYVADFDVLAPNAHILASKNTIVKLSPLSVSPNGSRQSGAPKRYRQSFVESPEHADENSDDTILYDQVERRTSARRNLFSPEPAPTASQIEPWRVLTPQELSGPQEMVEEDNQTCTAHSAQRVRTTSLASAEWGDGRLFLRIS